MGRATTVGVRFPFTHPQEVIDEIHVIRCRARRRRVARAHAGELRRAISCPDRTPPTINSPGPQASQDCQNAIAKAALSFVKKQLKTDTKCMSKQVPGACPSAKDTEKKQKEALKARDKVVKACTGALTGLTSSYSAATDPADVASCTLSQNNSEGRLLAFKVNGSQASSSRRRTATSA